MALFSCESTFTRYRKESIQGTEVYLTTCWSGPHVFTMLQGMLVAMTTFSMESNSMSSIGVANSIFDADALRLYGGGG